MWRTGFFPPVYFPLYLLVPLILNSMCAYNVGASASDGGLWVSDCENDICFSLLSLHCVDKVLI